MRLHLSSGNIFFALSKYRVWITPLTGGMIVAVIVRVMWIRLMASSSVLNVLKYSLLMRRGCLFNTYVTHTISMHAVK